MLNHKSILITGGTGSFGKAFIREVLNRFPDVKRVVVFSRDELKQFEMAQEFSPEQHPCLRYFIGDIRDKSRLKRVLEGVDVVVHAAALKQVPTAEYNPFECISTNVLGAQNLIECILDSQVEHVVALSTDKAAAPINLYGATKLCSDKLFIAANNMRGKRKLRFSVVRYGNVMGSRGSVIPFFMKKCREGVLPVTDERMTRFNITLSEGVDMVLHALEHALGGEIFVPKIPSYRIMDVAEAIGPGCKKTVVGIRPGEKLHEEMITYSDSSNTIENDHLYTIVPMLYGYKISSLMETYCAHHQAAPVAEGFRYSSGQNSEWLSPERIRTLIREHIDPAFEPV